MNGWERDKQRADIFMPRIKSILGRLFIGDAPVMEDQEQATDLMVFHLAPLTIACRMREIEYLAKYPNDVTIRFSRPSGTKTEYDKIVDGWADYFFYGFGDFNTGRIHAYKVIGLKPFRAALLRNQVHWAIRDNYDGSSKFMAIDARTLPDECICHEFPAGQRKLVA